IKTEEMKKITPLFILLGLLTFNSWGQTFTRQDFKITITGLSDEIKSSFENNIDVFVDKFNFFEIPEEMKPIQINIAYKDGVGEIQFKTSYTSKLTNDSNMGKPLAKYFYLFIPWRIFNAANSYLTNIALQTNRREVLKFDYTLTLTKPNKDWLNIYASSQGFYTNVHYSVGGKDYETETAVPSNLNRTYIFSIKETTGLDGKNNENYFLCQLLGL
ncbi:MAG: hypothetical protein ACKO96_31395, partial [Flammeovirgaceae bacterium]